MNSQTYFHFSSVWNRHISQSEARSVFIALLVICSANVALAQNCSITNTVPLPAAPFGVVYPSNDDASAPWTRLTARTGDGYCGTITSWSIIGLLPPGLSLTKDPNNPQWYITGSTSGPIGMTYPLTLEVVGSLGTATQMTSITIVQQTPSFSPALNSYAGAAGNGNSTPGYAQFTSAQNVMLSALNGATICYTLNSQTQDTEPSTDGNGHCLATTNTYTYTGQIPISSSTLIRAVATKSGMQDSNIVPGYYDIIVPGTPQLPQHWIISTFTSPTFSCLQSGYITKTVKATGGDYTSIQSAVNNWSADSSGGTVCVKLVVDSESAHFVTNVDAGTEIVINIQMQSGKYYWIQPSGYSNLPLQGSNTRNCMAPDGNLYGCTVSPGSDRTNMFEILKTVTDTNPGADDYGIAICGDVNISTMCPRSGSATTSGLIITGMDFQYHGTSSCTIGGTTTCSYLYDAVIVGDYTNTLAGVPSRIFFDRCIFDTQTGTFDTFLKTDIAVETATTFSVTDSYFDHGWEPLNGQGEALQGQDVGIIAGQGPFKIVNNFMAGTPVENFMIGGSTGGIVCDGHSQPNCAANHAWQGWPHDIEFRRNVISKNPTVILRPFNDCVPDQNYAGVANLFEFKGGAQRLLMEGNILLYSYSAGYGECYQQDGNVIALKIDQNGPPYCPLCSVTDLTVRYNDSGHANITIEAIGQDQGGKQYPVMQRVAVHDNRFFDINWSTYGATTAHHQIFEFGLFTSSGGGSQNSQALQSHNPGPWFYSLYNNAFYSTPMNNSGLTWLSQPIVCDNPGSEFPSFTFHGNISANDGLQGTGAGDENLDGDCQYSPYQYFQDGVFGTTLQGDFADFGNGLVGGANTGNVLFNFSNGGGDSCNTGTMPHGWGGVNPGYCPPGTPQMYANINTVLGIDYPDCAAGTATGAPNSSYADCVVNMFSNLGPNYSSILSARTLSNDYYATHGAPRGDILEHK
jgi:hypothetical protein